MFDKYTPFNKVAEKFNFSFKASTCKHITEFDDFTVQCNSIIRVTQNTDGSVIFMIENNNFEIKTELSFDIVYTSNDRFYCATVPNITNINESDAFLKFKLSAPIGFNLITRYQKDFSNLEPYVCSVFTINSVIKKLAFRFENPVKIIEFT